MVLVLVLVLVPVLMLMLDAAPIEGGRHACVLYCKSKSKSKSSSLRESDVPWWSLLEG